MVLDAPPAQSLAATTATDRALGSASRAGLSVESSEVAAAGRAAEGPSSVAIEGEDEENRMRENKVDARGYVVYDERSFLGWRRRAREVVSLVRRPLHPARKLDAGDIAKWCPKTLIQTVDRYMP